MSIKIVCTTVEHFPLQKMATKGNKPMLAAVSWETQEHPRNRQSQNISISCFNEEIIRQVVEDVEGRVSKKLSREISRTDSPNLGALFELKNILLNPYIRTLSRTVPGAFRETDVENQEPAGDHSQNDPHSEVEFFVCQFQNFNDSETEETSHNWCVNKTFFYLVAAK